MSQNTLLPDDPKLTAYALGELEEAERAAIEAALQQNPEVRAVVEGIRATAQQLSAALATEPMPAVKPLANISRSGGGGYGVARLDAQGKRKLIKFPEFYYVAGVAAAACFAVFVALQKPTPHPAPMQRQYTEITFTTPPATDGVVAVSAPATPTPAVDEAVVIAPAAGAGNERAGNIPRAVTLASNKRASASSESRAAVKASLDNAFLSAEQNPLSTFLVNVDTAAYANVRKFLESGARPPRDAVRIEGMVNYFAYDYAPPKDDKPFSASLEVASAPWSPSHRLVRIGLKSREATTAEQAAGNAAAIAQDVNVQVEFNPDKVASYRLLGYEDRVANKDDSSPSKAVSEDVAAGRTVTALYEVVPVGKDTKVASASPTPAAEETKPLRVRSEVPMPRPELPIAKPVVSVNELLTVKVNYKKPDSTVTRKVEFPLTDKGAMFADASNDFKFAAAVASFGMILRDSPHKGAVTLGDVIDWAEPTASQDSSGRRAEFIGLVRQAQAQMR